MADQRARGPVASSLGVAITGVGVVTASGTTASELFDDMRDGVLRFQTRRCPLVRNTIPVGSAGAEDDAESPELFAAHVTDPPLTGLASARASRAFGRDSRLFVYAGVTAARNAAVATETAADRIGVVCGTLRSGRNEYLAIHNTAHASDGTPVNPVWGPQSSYNAPAAQLSIQLPARGPNLTLSSNVVVGLEALAVGAQQLALGSCDAVVAGAVDTLSAAVAPRTPHQIRGPYDGSDEPIGEGEAAAAVVLASGPGAADRALGYVYARQHTFAPNSSLDDLQVAVEEAVRLILGQVDMSAGDVGVVVTSSTGDRAIELAECGAVAAVFGADVPVCNAVGTTGRTGGADGMLAVVTAVEAIRRGVVPPIGGLREPVSPLPALNLLRDGPVRLRRSTALCLGVERGGKVIVVLVGRRERGGCIGGSSR